MADARAWPGYARRFCPVCHSQIGTHREPTGDDRGEVVVYHDHDEPQTGLRCLMAGERAAIKAVAFSTVDTGIDQRTSARRLAERPRGSRAADHLLARLIEQERAVLR